jgi:hypothetical protein
VALLARHAAEGGRRRSRLPHAGRQRGSKTDDAVQAEATAQDHAASLVEAGHAAAVLSEVDPKHCNRHRPLLSLTITPPA